ncbi:MAG: phosphopentomutase [Eubacteriales bacterium]
MKRVFLIVLDSFGIGAMPDAYLYHDEGTNTMKSVASSSYFCANQMKEMGLFNIEGVTCGKMVESPVATIARMKEHSKGKDTTIGHWEIAGIHTEQPLPTYPNGFPESILEELRTITGRNMLCNLPYSGTKVIEDYGKQHVDTGDLIVYTSADSVLQIAAHEEIVPLETLYEYCHKARELMTKEHGVGRVIARPFIGEEGNYQRTSNRHDYSLTPPNFTMLDALKDNGCDVIGIGKINDIFVGAGITEYTYTTGNEDGIQKTIEYLKKDFNGLCFVNLVDYDMLYGHRNDIDGYAKAIAYFDEQLKEIKELLREEDLLLITADHGCDPGNTASTDHSREYVPFLMYGNKVQPQNLGTRNSFADIGATILDYFQISASIEGTSMWKESGN